MPSSDKNSARPILLPQCLHFPLRASQETMGMFSYHLSWCLQERQTERGPREDLDLVLVALIVLAGLGALEGVSLRCKRRAWQHKNDPIQAPKTKAMIDNRISMALF